MLNGLIFDLDGTLVDSLPGIASSLNHALAAHALPPHSLAAVRGFIGNGSRILIERAAPPTHDSAQLDAIEASFQAHYDANWPSGTSVFAGIMLLLETLQAATIPLTVLSNKPHRFTQAIVQQLFPQIHFAVIMGQLPGIPHKPDPSGALEIANLLQRLPTECTVIGDSTMDLETARNAKMQAIAVTWGFHDRAALIAARATQLVDSPAALLALILEDQAESRNATARLSPS
jgi:phosphoglycolate phosphatase